MYKKINSTLPFSTVLLLVVSNSQGFTLEPVINEVSEVHAAKRSNGSVAGPFIVSDFLYWQAVQEGFEYAVSSKSAFPAAPILSGKEVVSQGQMKQIDFDWGPGFRIGFGYQFGRDQWDLLLNWTRFHCHSSLSSRAASGGALFAIWVPNEFSLGECHHAHARWHLMYDVIDFEMGRLFHLTKAISAHPFIGLRGALIREHMKFEYEDIRLEDGLGFMDVDTHMKNGYFSGGLRAGTKVNFQLNRHWSLRGAVSASLLYGLFDVKLNFQLPNQESGSNKLRYNTNDNRTQANVEGSIGLQWETGYADGRYHFALLACYEFSEWFSQNKLLKSLATGRLNQYFLSNDGNLGLQGGTLSARFDY